MQNVGVSRKPGRVILAPLVALALALVGCNNSVESTSVNGSGGGAGAENPEPVLANNPTPFINTPNTLKATAGAAKITLTWTPPAGVSPVSYKIFRKAASASAFTELTSTGLMSYIDTTVANTEAYTYRVQSRLSNGTAVDTNEAAAQSVSPFVIRTLTQDASNNFVIAWDAAAGASAYDIVQGPGGGIYPSLLKANATSPATITGLQPGATFFVQVVAKNNVGDGARVLSSTVFRVVALPAFDFTLTNTPAGMTASWTPVAGVDGYEVVWGTSPGNYTSSAWAPATDSSFSTWSTNPGTTYYFMVYAYGGASRRAASQERSLASVPAVSGTWSYDAGTESQYVSSNSFGTMYLSSGGVCALSRILFADTDGSAAGFGGGTVSGLVWDSARNSLRLGNAGGCNGATASCATDPSFWIPRPKNLVGSWTLDGTGTAANGSAVPAALGPAGTTVSGGTTIAYVAGKAGQAVQLDGVDDEITISNDPTLQLSRGSFSAWFNTTNAGAGYRGIVTKQFAYGVFLNSNQLTVYDWGGGAGRAVALSPNDGAWHHVLVTFVAGVSNGVTIYVDGVFKLATTISISAQTQPLKIGSGNSPGQFFTGKIDEVMVWNAVLNADEARDVYQRSRGKYSGQLVSRVFDAMIPSSWPNLSWVTNLPYGKELPGAAASEAASAYSSVIGGLMTGNVGLWHFNETAGGTAPGGKDWKDDSGGGNHGTTVNATYGYSGKFGNAAGFYNALGINLGTPTFLHGASAMTVCSWVDYTGVADSASHSIARQQNSSSGQFAFGMGWVAHKARLWVNNSNTWYAGPDSITAIDDGKWHHVCGTFSAGTIRIYVDGVREASATVGTTVISSAAGNPLHVGAYAYGGEIWTGMIDELGIWSRALSDSEVVELYRRGANQVKLQVRSCSTASATTCTDGSGWKGPDGTSDTLFSELNNATTGSADLTLSAFTSPPGNNRYFQYRLVAESNDALNSCNYGTGATTCSPEIASVRSGGASAYDPSGPSVTGNTGLVADHLTQIVETLGSGGCAGGIGYALSLDKTLWYYWNGIAWVASNGTAAQSSTAGALNTGLSKFGAQVGRGTVYLRSFLKSNGAQPCELDRVVLHGRH